METQLTDLAQRFKRAFPTAKPFSIHTNLPYASSLYRIRLITTESGLKVERAKSQAGQSTNNDTAFTIHLWDSERDEKQRQVMAQGRLVAQPGNDSVLEGEVHIHSQNIAFCAGLISLGSLYLSITLYRMIVERLDLISVTAIPYLLVVTGTLIMTGYGVYRLLMLPRRRRQLLRALEKAMGT